LSPPPRKASGERMKSVASIAAIVTALAVCGVFLYQHYPVEERIVVNSPEYQTVESTTPRKVVESITIDGKTVEVGLIAHDTVRRQVELTASHELITQPDWMNTLKCCVLVGVVVYLGVYAAFVMFLWGRDKLQRRETKDTEDNKNRLSELGRLGGVILLTLFGGSADFSHRPINPTQANTSHDFHPGVPVVDVTPPELKPAPGPRTKISSPLEKTKIDAQPKL
jgi:hypothetical protein